MSVHLSMPAVYTLAFRKIHTQVLWTRLKNGRWAERLNCNCVSWDQLHQLNALWDILSHSHEHEVDCLVCLAAILTWRLMQLFFFSSSRRPHIYSVQPDLQLNSDAGHMRGPDIALQALILCVFQGIVGDSEAVSFLRWLSGCAAPLSSQCLLLTAAQPTSVWISKIRNTGGFPAAHPLLLIHPSDPTFRMFSSMTSIFLPSTHNPACPKLVVLDLPFGRQQNI